MSRIIHVKTGNPYDVVIERGALKRCGEMIKAVLPKARRVIVISDTNVFPIYGGAVVKSLTDAGYDACEYIFEAGEAHKRLDEINRMYGAMAAAGLSRTDFAVALGGGVVGDMCGFAAATYLRGIKFVQIPTTIVAQNDSSVGGKTGVDLECGKNLVGSFWQPSLVIADVDTLGTLPGRYITDGFGEIIKHGCIKSDELFEMVERNCVSLDNIEEITWRSVKIKSDVVERDERESGERMLLNFGHTIGHAVEKCSGFTKYAHGEAVGIGMVIMARAGETAGLTEQGSAHRIEALLKRCGMPTVCEFSTEQLCDAILMDKKRSGDSISVVLLKRIGDSFTYKLGLSELANFIDGGM